MKLSQSLIYTLPFLHSAAAQGGGMVGLPWTVSNVPETGLEEITFPIDISASPHERGFYFAQQFNFVGAPDVGYTGLQPRADINGQPIIHAAFSSFNAGTTSDDENCSDGADGGAGVSCAIDIVSPYEHQYLLLVENTQGTTWVGTLVDAVSGNGTRVGSWTLPGGSKGIKGSQLGFVELYAWNDGKSEHVCADVPKHGVTFGEPVAEGYEGSLGVPYEYGDCVGEIQYEAHTTADGAVAITVGY
ncbi:uncharacterized protein N7515_000536 [Penicillium bovifimosum]|uniref:Uncharacterized protein n=1 Tax=Penicillium bovifimosum TaxID=126998 RepID=A0A9W9HFK9_9EURO|nr:uncharacterized protein N7515_000536 [Penicillium bovifimosum]KAJ5145972.1 hypothetical protein N7515_000536 [Penicillium bovifimosum]